MISAHENIFDGAMPVGKTGKNAKQFLLQFGRGEPLYPVSYALAARAYRATQGERVFCREERSDDNAGRICA